MAAILPSLVRLAWMDPLRQAKFPLWESRTENMTAAALDVTKLPILPKYNKVFDENDYLILDVMPTTGAAIVDAGCIIRVPVTMYNKRTKQKFESVVDARAGQYHFTLTAGTTVTSVYYQFGVFQLPLGVQMKLGQDNAYNSKVDIQVSS
jgi:hypothetical protein